MDRYVVDQDTYNNTVVGFIKSNPRFYGNKYLDAGGNRRRTNSFLGYGQRPFSFAQAGRHLARAQRCLEYAATLPRCCGRTHTDYNPPIEGNWP